MLLLAHAGHWVETVILGLPLIAFGAWLAVTGVRERRRRRGAGDA